MPSLTAEPPAEANGSRWYVPRARGGDESQEEEKKVLRAAGRDVRASRRAHLTLAPRSADVGEASSAQQADDRLRRYVRAPSAAGACKNVEMPPLRCPAVSPLPFGRVHCSAAPFQRPRLFFGSESPALPPCASRLPLSIRSPRPFSFVCCWRAERSSWSARERFHAADTPSAPTGAIEGRVFNCPRGAVAENARVSIANFSLVEFHRSDRLLQPDGVPAGRCSSAFTPGLRRSRRVVSPPAQNLAREITLARAEGCGRRQRS